MNQAAIGTTEIKSVRTKTARPRHGTQPLRALGVLLFLLGAAAVATAPGVAADEYLLCAGLGQGGPVKCIVGIGQDPQCHESGGEYYLIINGEDTCQGHSGAL